MAAVANGVFANTSSPNGQPARLVFLYLHGTRRFFGFAASRCRAPRAVTAVPRQGWTVVRRL
jgi:hypothetical protein